MEDLFTSEAIVVVSPARIGSMLRPNYSCQAHWVFPGADRQQLYQISDKSFAWSAWERERAKEAEANLHLAKGQGVKGSSNLNEVKESIRTASEVAARIGDTFIIVRFLTTFIRFLIKVIGGSAA